MISAGMFVAASIVWVGCIAFIYKHNRKEEPSPKNPPKIPERSQSEKSLVENFREPIFLNKKKMWCDNYPRSNGSIYGEASHLMSGYPYYDKAY